MALSAVPNALKWGAFVAVLALLSACASSPNRPMAVAQPLVDFNIVREEVPAHLKAIGGQPYQREAGLDCATISAEIDLLDEILGPDIDVEVSAADQRANRRREIAGALLRSLTTSWIPARAVVRNLSGAESRERRMKEAILGGALRRAYLKGVSDQMGCATVAQPPADVALQAPAG